MVVVYKVNNSATHQKCLAHNWASVRGQRTSNVVLLTKPWWHQTILVNPLARAAFFPLHTIPGACTAARGGRN